MSHKPNDITRAKVKAWAEWLPQRIICARLGIKCAKTLRKHYQNELLDAPVERDIEVVKALYNSAINGNVSAQIYWCKSRMGMHDSPAAVQEEVDTSEPESMEIKFDVLPAKNEVRVKKGE